jgi:ribonucleotide reductase alpha subunit
MSNYGLSENAVRIFKTLYSFQDETIEGTFKRVAKEFANNDKEEQLAFDLLASGIWRPNTPVFLNAGKQEKVFSACYVVGLDDTMDSIYDVANVARKIFQHGSGIGIPIGNLRERDSYIYEGDPTKPPEGKSSGPITFMKLYDAVGETTKSGGRVRRAAIMCSMPVWHPDIMEFITCKEEDGRLSNMNISVNITDKFMQALKDRVPFELYTPHSNQMVGTIDSEELWDKLVEMSWKSADPGMIFIDKMNYFNSLKKRFLIDTTNPCGEQPLQPFSCCNLSAINLSHFCKDGVFDWEALYVTCYNVTGLMDNVIDKMDYPDERFKETAQKYRQIGIGPMGLADAMFWLDIKYDSAAGKQFAGEVMRIMTMACVDRSATLASEKEPFHDYEVFSSDIEDIVEYHIGHDINNEKTQAVMDKVRTGALRNSQFTTCQPTGCLTDSTLIASKKGLKKIIDYDKIIETYNNVQSISDFDIVSIKRYFDQGYAKTIKIITENGYELEGTYDHKVRVISQGNGYIWKELKDLNKNDYIIMKKGFMFDRKCLNFNKHRAEFIGFYMADGWYHGAKKGTIENARGKRLYFRINKSEEQYLLDLIERAFGSSLQLNPIIRPDEYSESIKVEINSVELYKWFKKYNSIKKGSENTFIPDFILTGSRDIILSFIKGFLHGDGHIHQDIDNLFLQFDSVSKVFMKQLHILLLGIGYPSNLSEENKIGEKIKFGNRISKSNYVRFRICIKSSYSYKLLKELGIKISEGINISKNYEKIPITPDESKFFPYTNIDGNLTYTTLDRYEKVIKNKNWFVKNKLFVNKIKNIIYSKNSKHVNDLEVSNRSHTYIANGFVTHNTTALSCDASYGIEPCFGLVFQKNVIDGTTMMMVNPVFEKRFRNEPWYDANLINKIFGNGGSLKGIHGIPKEVRDTFITAHDIKPKDRIDLQASLQRYCSTAISSTINLPETSTKEEISDIYQYAYRKGLKGVTIYRDGCKENQPVTFKKEDISITTGFDRPRKLQAEVFTVDTGNGKMYVTVSSSNGIPIEVFLQVGKSGQVLNTFSEALGRVVSIALQNGVALEDIIKTLININSDKPVWFRFEEIDAKPVQILSVPDGLAKLLQRYYIDQQPLPAQITCAGDLCPLCGQNSVQMIEGCKTCQCGFSEC